MKQVFNVGEEVLVNGYAKVITYIDKHMMLVIDPSGYVNSIYSVYWSDLQKTGRSFPELIDLLNRMEESGKED